ncbi:MAG: DNA repair protein RecO [Verrucomicrobia bacterium]|nr:MAG: DNA repair protein RecO [Verrucomicrobiota bacterium]
MPRCRSVNGNQKWLPYKSGGVRLVSRVNVTTRGILLRKRKLSDTSLIVSWCTDSLGILQTVARGGRRPKSPFRGQLDLFFEAVLSIAKSRKSNLHTLREVVVLNAFAGIRTDHRRTQAASYFVELIEVCTEIEHHEPEIFHLLERAFGYLDQHDPDQRVITHFETELARITGRRRVQCCSNYWRAIRMSHEGSPFSSRPAVIGTVLRARRNLQDRQRAFTNRF